MVFWQQLRTSVACGASVLVAVCSEKPGVARCPSVVFFPTGDLEPSSGLSGVWGLACLGHPLRASRFMAGGGDLGEPLNLILKPRVYNRTQGRLVLHGWGGLVPRSTESQVSSRKRCGENVILVYTLNHPS